MATSITINGQEYVIEKGTGGYTYYRTAQAQHFGKKVKSKNGTLAVWNGSDGTPNPKLGLADVEWGRASIYVAPPVVVDPLDIRNATFSSVIYDLTASYAPQIMEAKFNSDGTSFYTTNQTLSAVRQFNLSTPWDITSASYYGIGIVSSANSNYTFEFSHDGQYLFIPHSSGGTYHIYRYTLSTPYNITTVGGVYDHYVSVVAATRHGLKFIDNGSRLLEYKLSPTVVEYSLSTPYDLTTMIATGNTYTFSEPGFFTYSCDYSADGTRIYLLDFSGKRLYQYIMSTPWDITTIAFDTDVALPAGADVSDLQAMSVSDENKKMYAVSASTYLMYEIDCPEP